jgi:2-phosphosulfolactate phosphatase
MDDAVVCEWGLAGLQACLARSDAVVVVDVLSFCTSVDIAVSRGSAILPYAWRDDRAAAFAQEQGALLAGRRDVGFSLSPASLQALPHGSRLVLPSPNGATLSLATGVTPTFAGCLRNARAVARAAAALGKRVTVIAAGEQWRGGGLRFALEDWLGAGAVIHGLPGSRSAEAAAAEAAFLHGRDQLLDIMVACESGRELIERGFSEDVRLAAALGVSGFAPRLTDGAYRARPEDL